MGTAPAAETIAEHVGVGWRPAGRLERPSWSVTPGGGHDRDGAVADVRPSAPAATRAGSARWPSLRAGGPSSPSLGERAQVDIGVLRVELDGCRDALPNIDMV